MRRAAERQRALQEGSRGKLGVTELLTPQLYDGTGSKEGSKEWEERGSGLSSVKSLTEPDFLLLPAGARCPVTLLLFSSFTLPVDPVKTQSVIPQVQFLFDAHGASQHLEQCMTSDGHRVSG